MRRMHASERTRQSPSASPPVKVNARARAPFGRPARPVDARTFVINLWQSDVTSIAYARSSARARSLAGGGGIRSARPTLCPPVRQQYCAICGAERISVIVPDSGNIGSQVYSVGTNSA